MNIKHSKIKNTGILFELLVRQITADTLSGRESKAVNILKKYFVKSELGKEYKLYETLSKHRNLTEGKAEIVINSVVETSKGLNRGAIKRQKYNLIKEISTHYNIEDFFKTKLPNYKLHASLYTLLELYNTNINNPDQLIENKINILETLTSKSVDKQKVKEDIFVEFQSYDKDLRILTYKVLLEKFNEKYGNLSSEQKNLLREYIGNVSNTNNFKEMIKEDAIKIKKVMSFKMKSISDKSLKIKLTEVIELLEQYKTLKNVEESHISALLRYYSLINDLDGVK